MHTFQLIIGETVIEIHEPVGFDSLTIKGKRNDLHGFGVQNSDLPLEFWCENGGTQIKAEYDSKGQDGEVLFRVYCGGVLVFDGRLDLNTYENLGNYVTSVVEEISFSGKYLSRLKTTVDLSSVTSLDGGTIVPMEQVTASLHSQPISKISYWKREDDSLEAFKISLVNAAVPQFYLVGLEGPLSGKDELEITSSLGFDWTYDVSPYHSYEVQEGGIHTIELKVVCDVGFTPGAGMGTNLNLFDMKLVLVIDDLVSPTTIIIRSWLGLGGTPSYSTRIDEDYTLSASQLEAGWKVSLYLIVDFNDDGEETSAHSSATSRAGSFMRITAATITRASRAPGYLVHEVLEGLMNAVVGPTTDELIYSDYYGRMDIGYPVTGCGSMRLITNGLGIRNVPESPVTLSLDKTLKSLKAIDAIGANLERFADGRDPILRVEHFTRFYNPIHAITLNRVTSYKETVATEVIYNTVEVGYKKWETESAEGLAEVHTKREYSTPIQKYENKYEAISDILAGGTAIETQRRIQFEIEPRKDGRYDKDSFIICLVDASLTGIAPDFITSELIAFPHSVGDYVLGAYELEIATGPNMGTYTVVNAQKGTTWYFLEVSPPFPDTLSIPALVNTVGYAAQNPGNSNAQPNPLDTLTSLLYNLEITPRRNMLRHGQWLNIGLHYKDISDEYRFTYGEGNYTLFTFDDTVGCWWVDGQAAESDNVSVGSMASTHPARPELAEVEANISASDWLTIKNSIIRPQFDDPDAYGYIQAPANGTDNKGYLWDFAFQPATGKLTCKLLKKN